MRIAHLCLVAAAVLMARVAPGDEILLKNGNVIVGEILQEDSEQVTINVLISGSSAAADGSAGAYIKMTFPKNTVQRITRKSTVFKPVSRTAGEDKPEPPQPAQPARPAAEAPPPAQAAQPVARAGPEDSPESADTAAEPAGKAGIPELSSLDPDLQKQVDSWIAELARAGDEGRSKDIEQRLAALGEDVVPSVVKALLASKEENQRSSLIRILTACGDKRAIRALIEQMKGQRPVKRMRYAWSALKKITGQKLAFDFLADEVKKRNRDIALWEKWLEKAKPELPEQLGFEEKK